MSYNSDNNRVESEDTTAGNNYFVSLIFYLTFFFARENSQKWVNGEI